MRSLTAWATSLSVIAAMTCGCGDGDQGRANAESKRFQRKVVPVADVPKTLMDVAKKELPDVEFDTAWQNLTKSGAIDSYEIRGKQDSGKIREVRLALDGKVLEKE